MVRTPDAERGPRALAGPKVDAGNLASGARQPHERIETGGRSTRPGRTGVARMFVTGHLAELAANQLLHHARRLRVGLLRPPQLHLQFVYPKKHSSPLLWNDLEFPHHVRPMDCWPVDSSSPRCAAVFRACPAFRIDENHSYAWRPRATGR